MLHGTLGSPGNFAALAHELQARGRRVIGLEYGDRGTGDLVESAREVRDFLAQFPVVDVVGHSLGGLMGLRAAHELKPGQVRTLVGLGASWRGVPSMRFRRLIEFVCGAAYGQLMRHFPAHIPEGTHVVSIVSDTDTVVPASSSTLGTVVKVRGVHHSHLPNQVEAIIKALER